MGAAAGGQPNMFNQAANATTASMGGAFREMGFQPMQVAANSYQADQVSGGSYNPAMVNNLGFAGAGSASAQQVDPMAAQMSAAQFNPANLNKFINPHTQSVVDASMNDINRMSTMQRNQAAAEATAAGAFGGSRGALLEAEVLRNAMDQQARTGSQLRSQGFSEAMANAQQDLNRQQQASQVNAGNRLAALQGNQAANLNASITNANNQTRTGISNMQAGLQAALSNQNSANRASEFGLNQGLTAALNNQSANAAANQFNIGQDMNAQLNNQAAGLQGSAQRLNAAGQLGATGNLGFGQAQSALAMQNQAGNQQQALSQALIDAARGQWNGFTQAPQQALGYLGNALGVTQVPQTTTTSNTPGLFNYLQLGASLI